MTHRTNSSDRDLIIALVIVGTVALACAFTLGLLLGS
jgi:hypothetical protein